MANDTPDWKNLIQNDYLANNSLVLVATVTYTVNNLASGSSIIANKSDVTKIGLYDGLFINIDSSGGFNYTPSLSGVYYYDGSRYSDTETSVSTVVHNSNVAGQTVVIGMLPSATVYNGIYLNLTNNTGAAIANDTVTVNYYAMKAQIVVNNDSGSPVQTQGVHGNNAVSGDMSLPSSTATTVPGSQNAVVTRLIITPFNPNGAALNSLDRIFVEINGAIGAAIPIGGLASNTFGQPVEFDFGDGIALGANGIQLNPNDNVAAYVTLVTK